MARSRALLPFALVTTLSLLLVSSPALAAKPLVRTRITAHLTPATTLVNSAALVAGSVAPAGGTLLLQRLVGKTWTTMARQKPTTRGTFSFSVRAKAAAVWPLRVTRTASRTTKAGVSPRVTLHIVRTGYAVAAAAAPVTAPGPVVVTGSVAPKASGSVQVQLLTGAAWVTVATARLSASSTFTVSTAQPAGSLRLRVIKPFTTAIAAGTSAAFAVTVQPAILPPTITTTSLPQGRVGQPFFAALTASGGVPAYTWSATGLPAGLSLSAAGLVSGSPLSAGMTTVNATVTDTAGRSSTLPLALTVGQPAGRLYSVGYNASGQLGNDTNLEAHTVVPVVGQTAVLAAASGNNHAYALDADGTVWAWGDGTLGQLGNGNLVSNTITPTQVLGLTNVTAIAGMYSGGLALLADGTVRSWGSNAAGELGDGSGTNRSTPVQVVGLSGVVAIAAGAESGFALRTDGSVWSWGYNLNGDLGDGTTTSRPIAAPIAGLTGITAIAAGAHSGYALQSNGTEFAWGANGLGQLGDGTTTMRLTPVAITALSSVKAIAAADANGYALSAAGTVLAWGSGGFGALGDGTTTSVSLPVAVHNVTGVTAIAGNGQTGLARTADGSAWAWGYNAQGQLGDATTTDRTEPVQVLGLIGAIALGSGRGGGCNYFIGR